MKKKMDALMPVIGSVIICAALLMAMAWLVAAPPLVAQAKSVVAARPTPDERPVAPIPTQPSLPPPAPAFAPSSGGDAVVRSETRSYALPPTPERDDAQTFEALRRNCAEAAVNNAFGEYPALQQMACQRYSDFAASKGLSTGRLPAVRVAAEEPAPRAVASTAEAAGAVDSPCPGLIGEKDAINEEMRHGYTIPVGERLRARLEVLRVSLWQNHCPRQ